MTDKIIFVLFILGLISFFVWFVGYLTKRIKPSNRDDYSGGGDAGSDYGAHYDSSFGDGHSVDDGGHH